MAHRSLRNTIAIILILFIGVSIYFLNLHLVSVSVDNTDIEYKVNSEHLRYLIDKVEVRNFEKRPGIIGNEYLQPVKWSNIEQLQKKWGDYLAIKYAQVSNFYSKPKVFNKDGNVIEIDGTVWLIAGYNSIEQNLLRTNFISIKGIPSKYEIINSPYNDYVYFKCIGKLPNNFRLDQPIELVINNKAKTDKKNFKLKPNWIQNTYYSGGLFDFSKEPSETIWNYLVTLWHG